MTRCVYLTFFGEYRGHGHPHESEPRDHVPLIILVGVLGPRRLPQRRPPFHIEKFTEWVEPRSRSRRSCTPSSTTRRRRSRCGRDRSASASPRYFWFQREELGPLKGLTQRNKLAHAGYTFLDNKYYLDALYENVIVASIKGPIATAVLLGQPERDRRGRQRRRPRCAGRSGSSPTTSSTRRASTAPSTAWPRSPARAVALLRYFQSGRVQRYALLLFAAVGLLSLFLLLANHLIRGESFRWTGSTTGP